MARASLIAALLCALSPRVAAETVIVEFGRKVDLAAGATALVFVTGERGVVTLHAGGKVTAKYADRDGKPLGEGGSLEVSGPAVVHARLTAKGATTVRFEFQPDHDVLEPNDTVEQAKPVALGVWEQVSLPSGDDDFLRVELPVSGHLFLDTADVPNKMRVQARRVAEGGRRDNLATYLEAGTHVVQLRSPGRRPKHSHAPFRIRFRLETGGDDFVERKLLEVGPTYAVSFLQKKDAVRGFEVELKEAGCLSLRTFRSSYWDSRDWLRNNLAYGTDPLRVIFQRVVKDGKELDLAGVFGPLPTRGSYLHLQPGRYQITFRLNGSKYLRGGIGSYACPVFLSVRDPKGAVAATAIPMELNTTYRLSDTQWRKIEVPGPGSLTVAATTYRVESIRHGASPASLVWLMAADGKTRISNLVQPSITSAAFAKSTPPARAVHLDEGGTYYIFVAADSFDDFQLEANFAPDGPMPDPTPTAGFATIHAGLALDADLRAETRANAYAAGAGFVHDETGEQIAAKLEKSIEVAEQIITVAPEKSEEPESSEDGVILVVGLLILGLGVLVWRVRRQPD